MKNESDKWRQSFEQHWQEKFGEPYVPKEMTEEEKKALEEAEKRVFDYDPSDEELEKLYGKDFDDSFNKFLKDKLGNDNL